MGKLTRRNLLKLAGAAAILGAGEPLLTACSHPGPHSTVPSGDPLDCFDHVVVLMMENRSLDNVLGYLYAPGQVPRGQQFDGVWGKEQALANPIPPYAIHPQGHLTVPVAKGSDMSAPSPDPGEEYPHVNTQAFNTVIPEQNRFEPVKDMAAPFNAPSPIPSRAPMNGFVTDYVNAFIASQGRAPAFSEYAPIMNCFTPDALPVINTLARQFAVCDHWFCDVPSQTYTNRSFFHAASSSGFVINSPYINWPIENKAETIFNRMNAQGIPWRIYFNSLDIVSLTALIHWPQLQDSVFGHFCYLDKFFDDVRNGALPRYSFIEPSFYFEENSMHPPSNVLPGDRLINRVYEAIRNSNSLHGSNYTNTLLIITFDEHGGCFDHVSPPAAPSPDPAKPVGQEDFRFDRLGCRVPTVLVSAFIEPGTVINTPLQHTSLIKTLSMKWKLGALTERDKSAPDFLGTFNRSKPRDRSTWPVITPRPVPSHAEPGANLQGSLNGLQRDILGLVAALDGKSAPPPTITTVEQALLYISQTLKKLGLFPFCL